MLRSIATGSGEGGFKLSYVIGYEKRDVKVIKDKRGIDEAGLKPDIRLLSDVESLNMEIHAGYKGLNVGFVYGLDDYPYTQKDYFTNELIFDLQGKTERIALFATYGYSLLRDISVDISGRYDRYRYFDVSIYSSGIRTFEVPIIKESFNPKLTLKWSPKKSLTFRGSAGTGFIPPGVSSLYYKEIRANYLRLPNPDLKPEMSFTADLGVEGEFYGIKSGLTFFYTRWLDKIESLQTPGPPITVQMQNIGESESKGVEVSLDKGFEWGLNSSFNYTLTMTEITKSATLSTIGNELSNSPKHRFNLILSYEGIKDLTGRASIRYESSQFTDSRNIVRDENGYKWEKAGYGVVDLSVIKKLKVWNTPVDMTFAADNLFDEQYQKGFFQKDPGRLIRGEAAVKF